MDRNGPYSLRTVEEVFSDYNGRRKGIIRALTVGNYILLYARRCIYFSFSLGLLCCCTVLALLILVKFSKFDLVVLRCLQIFWWVGVYIQNKVHAVSVAVETSIMSDLVLFEF